MYKKLFNYSLAVIVCTTLAGCVSPTETTEYLRSIGYTSIDITGFKPNSCKDREVYRTGFTAKDIAGKIVEGTICSTLVGEPRLELKTTTN